MTIVDPTIKDDSQAAQFSISPMQAMSSGFQQITSLSSSTAPTIPSKTRWILAQAETQSVRYRLDGTAPTASVGMIIYAGDPPTPILITQGVNFIEVAASAKLNLTYLK